MHDDEDIRRRLSDDALTHRCWSLRHKPEYVRISLAVVSNAAKDFCTITDEEKTLVIL